MKARFKIGDAVRPNTIKMINRTEDLYVYTEMLMMTGKCYPVEKIYRSNPKGEGIQIHYFLNGHTFHENWLEPVFIKTNKEASYFLREEET